MADQLAPTLGGEIEEDGVGELPEGSFLLDLQLSKLISSYVICYILTIKLAGRRIMRVTSEALY